MSHPEPKNSPRSSSYAERQVVVSRRAAMTGAGGAAILAAALPNRGSAADPGSDRPGPEFKATNKNIRHSVMGWCFNPMPALELAGHCKAMGMLAMEGISAKHYPAVKKLGLAISLVGSHGFKKGPCDPKNRDYCVDTLRKSIDLAAQVGAPGVITFTGMRVKGLSDKQMTDHCIAAWKQIAPYAEKKNINLCLEHLNSRDNTHPMKGHPGYYGDDVDHCASMIRRVDSPRMKLLFDVYHVQIMNGDVIRRIRQYKDLIGHYHTAGNPGRGELDETQEINYPPVMRAIAETGYKGYVAHEFIPTWKDPIAALRHGVKVCDV